MTPEALPALKRPKELRPGPKALYILFFNAVKEERVLKRAELFSVYERYVARGKSDRPTWATPTSNSVWRSVNWNEWEWDRNFETWFVYTLGSLLKRGYLKIIPAVDLSKIEGAKSD